MNRIRDVRIAARLEIAEAADAAGVDFVEFALAERGLSLIHLDTVTAISDALEVSPADIYPDLGDALAALEAFADGEEGLSREDEVKLLSAGIDPDPARWYAVVTMRSGAERKYLLDSREKDRLRSVLAKPAGPGGMVSFYSDCRFVVARQDAVSEVRITSNVSYARFSSHEVAMKVTLLRSGSARPETVSVMPDEDDNRPFSEFVDAVAEDRPLPAFLLAEDEEGEERYIQTGLVELAEIPVGVTRPEIYTEEDLPAVASPDRLEDMEVKGHA